MISVSQCVGFVVEFKQMEGNFMVFVNSCDSFGYVLFGGEFGGDVYECDVLGNVVYIGMVSIGEFLLGEGQMVMCGVIGFDFFNFDDYVGNFIDLLVLVCGLGDVL